MRLLAEEWVPLLQRMTSLSASWGVWKNADRALRGQGDVDSTAPASEHVILTDEFRRWAGEIGLTWMVECRHAGAMLGLFGLDRARWAQLDIADQWPFRGARLFSARDLVPFMVMDPRGFRRLRAGAEGLLLFLNKGLDRTGRAIPASLSGYGILEKISEDRAGAEAAADLLGPAGAPLLRAVEAATEGEWDRYALVETQVRMVVRALSDPRMLLTRGIARVWTIPRCAVNREVVAGRRPRDVEGWIRVVERNHPVYRIGPEVQTRRR